MTTSIYGDISPPVKDLIWKIENSMNEEYMFTLTDDPTLCRFPIRSRQRVQELKRMAHAALADTKGVAAQGLGDNIVLDVFKHKLSQWLGEAHYYDYSFELAPFTCILSSLGQAFANFKLDSPDRREAYLARLSEYSHYVIEQEEKVRRQFSKGIRIHEAMVGPVINNIKGLIYNLRDHPLEPAISRLKGLDARTKGQFLAKVNGHLARINQAFEKVIKAIEETSGQQPSTVPGLTSYPRGDEYYKFLIRKFTGLDLTADEIFEIGMAEVNSIREEAKDIAQELKIPFSSIRKLNDIVVQNPNYKDETKELVAARYQACIESVQDKMEKYFLPTDIPPCRAAPLPIELEEYVTFGYYSSPRQGQAEGIYYFNGSDLANKSMLNCAALAYHELLPGHHLHFSRMKACKDIPILISDEPDMAFIEGWAEYAADLAEEMGLYSDPYYRFGRLSNKLFVALRLVLDSGLNVLGMSLEEGRKLMKDNLVLTDKEINSELLRYSCDMPGQALSYGIGSGFIKKMRLAASRSLGDDFDIRVFHERLLTLGAVPLFVLEQHMEKLMKIGV